MLVLGTEATTCCNPNSDDVKMSFIVTNLVYDTNAKTIIISSNISNLWLGSNMIRNPESLFSHEEDELSMHSNNSIQTSRTRVLYVK